MPSRAAFISVVIGIGLLAVAAAPPTALAKPRCTGVFKKSCLKKLFKCFDPSGACTSQSQLSDDLSQATATTCWENGARSTTVFVIATGTGTLTATNSKGKVCTTATSTSSPAGVETTYTRKGKQWVVGSSIGGLSVTCPNGKTETYTPPDLAIPQPRCTGASGATCQIGTCP